MSKFYLLLIGCIVAIKLPAQAILGGTISHQLLNSDSAHIYVETYWESPFSSNEYPPTMLSIGMFDGSDLDSVFLIDRQGLTGFYNINPGGPCFSIDSTILLSRPRYDTLRVALPSSDNDITFRMIECCRLPQILNIINPSTSKVLLSTTISLFARSELNKPARIAPYLLFLLCKEASLSNRFVVNDPDGDQIILSICEPLTASYDFEDCNTSLYNIDTEVVDFINPPYSALQPLGQSNQIYIDPSTGDLSGIINEAGIFVSAVCLKEVRAWPNYQ